MDIDIAARGLDRLPERERDTWSAKMEAEYVGYYLGRSLLSKGTTGLGVIQKPLRERYFAFRKSPENKPGPEVGIRVNPRGIEILSAGTHPGQDSDEFYDLSSVHFIEAVRFVFVKQKDKKFYGAFVPIQENPDAVQDKLFEQIEKKNIHLTKIPHPPLLACIMRRPSGVKAVDCHMFLVPRVEDAVDLADMVHRFQERPGNPDYFYGKPPLDGRREMPPDMRRDMPPTDMGFRGNYDRGPEYGDRKVETGNYEIYRGAGRGVELRQEHFAGGENRPLSEPNRSFERDRMPPRNGDYEYNRDRGPPVELRPKSDSRDPREYGYPVPGLGDRRSRELKSPTGAVVERDSYGNVYEFDNNRAPIPVLERQRSQGERSNDRYDIDRPPSERFSGPSPRNEFAERPGGGMSPRVEYNGQFPGPGQNRGSYPRPGQGRDLRRSDDYDQPPYPRPYSSEQPPAMLSPRSRSPPRGHSSPRSRSPEHEEIYSASNIESRAEADAHGKPVAKVPPNRHAGVRVLPSLPIPGALGHLKPVAKKADDNSIKRDTNPPSYNFNNRSQEEDPYDNAQSEGRGEFRQTRVQSDRSPMVDRRPDGGRIGAAQRVKSDDYSYGNKDDKQPPKQWSFNDEKDKFIQNRENNAPAFNQGYKSKSSHELGHAGNYGKTGEHAKDLEIEEMFSYLNTDNSSNKGDVDFERSLGYLP